MLGSDYPFPLGEHHPGKLIEGSDSLSAELKVMCWLQCDVIHTSPYDTVPSCMPPVVTGEAAISQRVRISRSG